MVGAERLAALLVLADVSRAQGCAGLRDWSVALGAGMVGAVRLAAVVQSALATGALECPGVVDWSVAVRAAEVGARYYLLRKG